MLYRFLVFLLLATVLPLRVEAAPDFTASVDVQVTPVQDKGKVEYTITLSNAGSSSCDSTWWVNFWPIYPCDCSTPPWECNQAAEASWEFTSADLGPGESLQETAVKFLTPTAVPYTYMLYVDSWIDDVGFCAESNETNNLACGNYVVDDSIGGPDLQMTDCSVTTDPETPSLYIFSATVENVGGQATTVGSSVEFYVDSLEGECTEFTEILGDAWAELPAGLQPGESVTVHSNSYGPLPAGQYLSLAYANAMGELAEVSKTDNCCQAELLASDRPDLIVDGFSVTLQGTTLYMEGAVINQGYRDVTPEEPFKVCIYYDSLQSPGLCETPDVEGGAGWAMTYGDGLEMNGVWEFGTSRTGMPNGTYNVWARADCDCELLEADEKNNDAKEVVVVDMVGPDLKVKVFTGKQIVDNEVSQVSYFLMVSNEGEEPVEESFDIDLFFHSETEPGDDAFELEGEYLQGPPLGPGEYYQTEILWAPLDGVAPGEYRSWVILDVLNNVWETSEENNVTSITVGVEDISGEGPNLTVEKFTARVIGVDVNYTVSVRNTGDKDILAPFLVDVFTDRQTQPGFFDVGDLRQEVESLRAGDAFEWTTQWLAAPDGQYLSYLVVDSENRTAETFEGDNIAGPLVSVVCRTCDQCPEDTYISSMSGCICGEETITQGFCCGGEWRALGCPTTEVEGEDIVQAEGVIELDNPYLTGESCGCRVAGGRAPGVTTWWVMATLLLFWLLLRSTVRVDPRS